VIDSVLCFSLLMSSTFKRIEERVSARLNTRQKASLRKQVWQASQARPLDARSSARECRLRSVANTNVSIPAADRKDTACGQPT